MATETKLTTAEELARMPSEDAHVELVKGVIVRTALACYEHSRIAGNLVIFLGAFLAQNPVGELLVAAGGFVLARNPDTVRAPDAAFVTHKRAGAQAHRPGFFQGAPDLAVEVVSPGDTAVEVEAKVLEYLQAGARLVWVLYPDTRTVKVHAADRTVRWLGPGDTLTGDDLLPGFTLPLDRLFE